MTARQQRRAQERLTRKKDGSFAREQDIPSAPKTSNHFSGDQDAPSAVKQPSLTQPDLIAGTKPPTPPSARAKPDYAAIVAASSAALLLPSEDAALYRTHLLYLFEQHSPAPGVESVIVQRLADLQWRLRRIGVLEVGILALGHRKYAELFTDSDPATRTALLDAHTLAAEASVFKHLHMQETRLRRYYATDLKELTAIQQNRQNPRAAASAIATQSQTAPSEIQTSMPLSDVGRGDGDEDGFEFSNSYDLDFSNEPEPADCLQFMVGSEFSTDAMCAGTVSAENRN